MNYLDIISGEINQKKATLASTGTADADKILRLGADGLFDSSTYAPDLPVDEDIFSLFYSDIAPVEGDLVHIQIGAGNNAYLVLADYALGLEAHGFFISGTSGNMSVSFSPVFVKSSDFTPSIVLGSEYFLGLAGQLSTTPPTNTGDIVQKIGIGLASDTIGFRPKDYKVVI